MPITLLNKTLCCILWKSPTPRRIDKIETIKKYIAAEYKTKIVHCESTKLKNFVKLFEEKMRAVRNSVPRFKLKYEAWMEYNMEIKTTSAGPPYKPYEDLVEKSKKKRQSEILSTHTHLEIKDSFKEMLKRKDQPVDALKIADILPEASPKRLKRIITSIPTPSSKSEFTEEEAIALMLELKLSRNKYMTLRKALCDKGHSILPTYQSIYEKKQTFLPSPIEISERRAFIEMSPLLENTASRIVSTFSEDQMKDLHNCDVTLVCKWGCDGLSALPEYKQAVGSQCTTDYKSVFMSSLVPLRMRALTNSADNFHDVWSNSTPGSKDFCRPIRFEYVKESTALTKDWVDSIKREIDNINTVPIEMFGYSLNMSFQLHLTMIDGKVCNAITDTKSSWHCTICGDKKSEFSNTSKERTINKEVLEYGISPLHARIRFLEYILHIAYDLKYRSIPGNEDKPVRNNKELIAMRASEKSRIQEEFKELTGLNIDKPLSGYGSTNDGNTSRRVFQDYEITSQITGIDAEVLLRFHIILTALNSKYQINAKKFGVYASETSQRLFSLYKWREITPTVHKVLCHGQIIIENNLFPLGELSEEAQEARNSDFKNIQFFNTRKCSRKCQNQDLVNNLLLSSDPALSSIRRKWVCGKIFKYGKSKQCKQLYDLLDISDPDTSDYFIEIQ